MRRREKTQKDFVSGELHVVVANDAFGMGIDDPCVRRVYILFPPRQLPSMLNQIGRAGRDGAPAACILVARPSDFHEQESCAPRLSQIAPSQYPRTLRTLRTCPLRQ